MKCHLPPAGWLCRENLVVKFYFRICLHWSYDRKTSTQVMWLDSNLCRVTWTRAVEEIFPGSWPGLWPNWQRSIEFSEESFKFKYIRNNSICKPEDESEEKIKKVRYDLRRALITFASSKKISEALYYSILWKVVHEKSWDVRFSS